MRIVKTITTSLLALALASSLLIAPPAGAPSSGQVDHLTGSPASSNVIAPSAEATTPAAQTSVARRTATFTDLKQAQADGVAATLPQDPSSYKNDQIIVMFNAPDPDLDPLAQSIDQISAGTSVTAADTLSSAQDQTTAVYTLPDDVTVEQAMLQAANDPKVAYVQPNYLYRLSDTASVASTTTAPAAYSPMATPNDPRHPEQWGLTAINASQAWDLIPSTAPPVTVAVVDTGARLTHKDLVDNLAKDASGKSLAWDAVGGKALSTVIGDKGDGGLEGHGTHVSGIVDARTNNNLAIAGTGNNLVKVLPVRVFYQYYDYYYDVIVESTSSEILIAAYQYLIPLAKTTNLKAINLSLGGPYDDVALHTQVKKALQAGILTVAAAGNESSSAPTFPSDWSEVISVTAVGGTLKSGQSVPGPPYKYAIYTNYGAAKDIAAPGGDGDGLILSLGSSSDSATMLMEGTSQACPTVSSAVGLVGSFGPKMTPQAIQNILYATATDLGTPGRDDYYGNGLLNLQKAVSAASAYSSGGASGTALPTKAPKITKQPAASASYLQDAAAQALSVTAIIPAPYTGSLSYQWYSNTTASTSGATAVSGATSATWAPPTSADGTLSYFCRVTAKIPGTLPGAATIDSGFATVTVTIPTVPPSSSPAQVTASPTTILDGGSVTISWTKVPDATKYRLALYRQSATGAWATVDIGGAPYADYGDIMSVKLTGITPIGTYKALVNAGNNAGWRAQGTYSNTWAVLSNPKVTRMGGADRYATAVAIAKQGWPTGASTVLLANGTNYPDALAATPLAAIKDAPILLTTTASVPKVTMDEIKALKPKSIILLGGTGAISSAQATALKNAGYSVTRYGGANRYETARLIGNAVEALGGSKTAILVTGVNYPDALSMGTIAGMNTMPIIFSTASGLPPETKTFIAKNQITKIVTVGYTASNVGIKKDAQNAVGSSNVTYITGADRYATSLAVANKYKKSFANGVAVATGTNFPDALTGGVLAAKMQYPVLLVNPTSGATAGTKTYVKALASPAIYVFGGTGVLKDAIVKSLYQ